jgi:hypothetical protein
VAFLLGIEHDRDYSAPRHKCGQEDRTMAQRSRPTITKRQREQARIAKQKDKAARRADRARQGSSAPALPGDVDPDIADIRPGPQPLADWQIDTDDDA